VEPERKIAKLEPIEPTSGGSCRRSDPFLTKSTSHAYKSSHDPSLKPLLDNTSHVTSYRDYFTETKPSFRQYPAGYATTTTPSNTNVPTSGAYCRRRDPLSTKSTSHAYTSGHDRLLDNTRPLLNNLNPLLDNTSHVTSYRGRRSDPSSTKSTSHTYTSSHDPLLDNTSHVASYRGRRSDPSSTKSTSHAYTSVHDGLLDNTSHVTSYQDYRNYQTNGFQGNGVDMFSPMSEAAGFSFSSQTGGGDRGASLTASSLASSFTAGAAGRYSGAAAGMFASPTQQGVMLPSCAHMRSHGYPPPPPPSHHSMLSSYPMMNHLQATAAAGHFTNYNRISITN